MTAKIGEWLWYLFICWPIKAYEFFSEKIGTVFFNFGNDALMGTLTNVTPWNLITLVLFITSIILTFIYVYRIATKDKILGHYTLIATIVTNIILYIMPVIYVKIEKLDNTSVLWLLIEQIGDIIKMFVGEVNIESDIYALGGVAPLYSYVFALCLLNALILSFYAAAAALSDKIENNKSISKKTKTFILDSWFKSIIKWALKNKPNKNDESEKNGKNGILAFKKIFSTEIKSCDIIIGTDDDSLEYAAKNDAIILKESSDENSSFQDLIANKYTVINKDFSVAFLKSSFFKRNHRYNFIYIGEPKKSIKLLNIFMKYLDEEKEKKHIYFYVQIPEDGIEMIQNHISNLYKNDERIHRITVFGRHEIVVRDFVEKEPITKFMPKDYIDADYSIKPEKKINVVMLGFTPLNQELLKQFFMNNQLATYKDGEYKLFPVKYHIFKNQNEGVNWEGFGIYQSLDRLEHNNEGKEYFDMPEFESDTFKVYDHIPNVNDLDSEVYKGIMCAEKQAEPTQVKPYDAANSDIYSELTRVIEQASGGSTGNEVTPDNDIYTCIFIDTGDIYLNLKLENKLSLLAANKKKLNYHIYVRRGELFDDIKPNVDCYGDYEKIFSHDIIVGEKLMKLAKLINNQYLTEGDDPETEWKKLKYFDMYSNIYTANSLRLKLHLMGLDYTTMEKKEAPKKEKPPKKKLFAFEKNKVECENYQSSKKDSSGTSQQEEKDIQKAMDGFPKKTKKSDECEYKPKEGFPCSGCSNTDCKSNPRYIFLPKDCASCLIKKEYSDHITGFLKKSKSNSMLAQEHYRWNAYHLMSGYLPKAKPTEKFKLNHQKRPQPPIKKTRFLRRKINYASRKDNVNKKHYLLTTYNGIKKVADYLYAYNVPACNLGFYENDGLIFEILPKYLEENGYVLISKK